MMVLLLQCVCESASWLFSYISYMGLYIMLRNVVYFLIYHVDSYILYIDIYIYSIHNIGIIFSHTCLVFDCFVYLHIMYQVIYVCRVSIKLLYSAGTKEGTKERCKIWDQVRKLDYRHMLLNILIYHNITYRSSKTMHHWPYGKRLEIRADPTGYSICNLLTTYLQM